MSEVRLVIRDASRDLTGTCHGGAADRVVAALSAEPESIEELDAAIDRFAKPGGRSHFSWFRPGIFDEPHDAGVVVVDLAARLIAYESSYSSPGKRGMVDYHDGTCATNHFIRYQLPDDWLVVSATEAWQVYAQKRRQERSANPPLDTREVLYGPPLIEFIARQCWQTFLSRPVAAGAADSASHASSTADAPAYPHDIEDGRERDDYDLVRAIHVAWMMTARDDLRGRTPREVMQERHDLVSSDLDGRAHQWSCLGFCPPGLSPESHAFHFAGFGTHEHVLYYYLLRQLLWTCRDRVGELAPNAERLALVVGDFLAEELPRLAAVRDRWLDGPSGEYHGRTPRSIIDRERARLPEAVGAGEMMIDHDCPLCQMMADEMHGPTFWHLDGCNMDDDFAFAYHHATLAEWEQERREWEEFDRKFEARRAEEKRLGVSYPGSGYADPDGVWKSSFVADDGPGVPVHLRLFSIGSRLAEVTADLKQPPEDRPAIDALSRQWGNLREVLQSASVEQAASLIEPVLDQFCRTLDEVAAEHEPLRAKCESLGQMIRRLLEPPAPPDSSDHSAGYDDIPF
jgi:hypothetical protein